MQLKKIQTGVVYASHRSNSEYSRDSGVPVTVLDATIWEESGREPRIYRRAPGEKAGSDGSTWGMHRRVRGVPVLKLHSATAVDQREALDALAATAKDVASTLAELADRKPFSPNLPESDDYRISFEILNPREVQAEWNAYVTEKNARNEQDAADRKRWAAEKAEKEATEQAAIARIQAVLPDHDVIRPMFSGGVPSTPTVTSWAKLADLLDAYADARS